MIKAQIAALKAKQENESVEDSEDDEEEMTEEELNLAHSLIRSGEEPLKLSLNMATSASKKKLITPIGGFGGNVNVKGGKDILTTVGKRTSDDISSEETIPKQEKSAVASAFETNGGRECHQDQPAVKKVAMVANTFLAGKTKGTGSLKLTTSQLNSNIIPVNTKPVVRLDTSTSTSNLHENSEMSGMTVKGPDVPNSSTKSELSSASKPLTTIELLMQEEEKRKKTVAKKEEKESRKDYWLHENIVVKVMNKKLSGGKFYKRKAVIRRVMDQYVGEVKLLEDGVITKTTLRLDQDDLETVIPKIGHKLLVVNGRGRGCRGTLLKINEEDFNVDIKLEEGIHEDEVFVGIPYEDISKLYS